MSENLPEPTRPAEVSPTPLPPVGPSQPAPYSAPYPGQIAPGSMSVAGKTRSPLGAWALTIVTFGIYWIVWYYKVNRELHDFDFRTGAKPGASLAAVTIGAVACGIPPLVSTFNCAKRISVAQSLAGRRGDTSGFLFFLANIAFGLGIVYYQSKLNGIWKCFGSPPAGTPLRRA